jgi:hypothetical protein
MDFMRDNEDNQWQVSAQMPEYEPGYESGPFTEGRSKLQNGNNSVRTHGSSETLIHEKFPARQMGFYRGQGLLRGDAHVPRFRKYMGYGYTAL